MSVLESRRILAVLLSVVAIGLLANVLALEFSRPAAGASTSNDAREIVPLSGGVPGIHGGYGVFYALPTPPGGQYDVIGYCEIGSDGTLYQKTQVIPSADFNYVSP
jgi:hypothetical protein